MKKNFVLMGLLALLMLFGVFMFFSSQRSTSQNSAKFSDTKTETDKSFINDMIEHHMGAISMAKEAQEKSQRDEIKQLSNNIIAAQEKEITMLYDWKKNWYNDTDKVEIQGGHGASMMQDLGNADEEFDLRFINAMVDHHQGAIDMANNILKTTQRAEIKTLAQNIIADQSKEISQMNEWKKSWYRQ